MTVDASAPGGTGDDRVPTPAPDDPPVMLVAPPRPGELTPRWRFLVAVVWIAVAVAQGAVWRTSDQLGMSTWWLGPRGDPRPLAVQLLPFLPALVMVLAASNRIRFLPWWGAVSSAVVLAIGIADLGTVTRLAWVEIAIGAAALAVSVASRAGAYRPGAAPDTGPEHASAAPTAAV